jgi:hypothetical protein
MPDVKRAAAEKKTVAEQAAESAREKGFGGDHLSEGLTDPLISPAMHGPAGQEPRQQSRDLDGLLSTARATEGHFISVFTDLAARTGGVGSFPGVKKLARTKEKIGKEVGDGYGGDAGRVTDLVRGGITYPTIKEAEAGLKAIELMRDKKNFKSIIGIPSVKQRFEDPEVGYKDINLRVTMGNGFIAEVQLSVKAISEAKKMAGHKVYDVVRVLKPKADSLTAVEKADLVAFEAFSDEIYAKAFALAKDGASVDADLEAEWTSHPTMKKVLEYKERLGV